MRATAAASGFRASPRDCFCTVPTRTSSSPAPNAPQKLGITVGARVTFRYQGGWLEGRVNRVTKRATVLVDDPTGERWSDGRRYARYYVPLGELRLAPT